ncbi:MAG: hypothetical protein JSU83_19230 [Deltaproteobacteria bacterium]|nr:MAG: hypothetical protein JSU83_19230 [Deltaproteobacteria bacterium]
MDKSKSFFQKSVQLMEAIGNRLGIASPYLHLGRLYISEIELDEAFAYLAAPRASILPITILKTSDVPSTTCRIFTLL